MAIFWHQCGSVLSIRTFIDLLKSQLLKKDISAPKRASLSSWCLINPVLHQLHTGGIIILKDTSEEEEELVEPVSAHGPKIEEEEQEPEPPEPFEYIDE